jgi:hypothetical protein
VQICDNAAPAKHQRMVVNRMQEMAPSCAAIRGSLTESSLVRPTLVWTMDPR